jgi:hypothetical protein
MTHHMHIYQRVLGVAGCSALLLGASACSLTGGSPSQSGAAASASPSPTVVSADVLANRSVDDLKAARSVRLKGTEKDGGSTISENLLLVTGKGCTGSIGMGGKGTVQLTLLGRKLWIKPDRRFWQGVGASGPNLAAVEGKYIATTVGSKAFGKFAAFCDAKTLAQNFTSASGLTRGPVVTVDGQSAASLNDPTDHGVAYVTDTATPQLLRLTMKGADGGQIDFLDYNKPATIAAPHAALTVPGSKFGF